MMMTLISSPIFLRYHDGLANNIIVFTFSLQYMDTDLSIALAT